MNRRFIAWVASCVLATGLPSASVAQRGQRGNAPNPQGQQTSPGQRVGQILRQRLDLTDAQVPKMQETIERFRGRRQGLGQ